jgi:hypothetical protein
VLAVSLILSVAGATSTQALSVTPSTKWYVGFCPDQELTGGMLKDLIGTATMGLGLRFRLEWEALRNGSTCFLAP